MATTELDLINNVNNIDSEILCYNSLPLELRRVKLYEVNPENGNWIDCGTGYLSISKERDELNIVVSLNEIKMV